MRRDDADPRCFTGCRNEWPRRDTEKRAECTGSPGRGFGTAGSQVPGEVGAPASAGSEVCPASEIATAVATRHTTAAMTSEDAVRLAIKIAVDGGEYERAAALIAVLREKLP